MTDEERISLQAEVTALKVLMVPFLQLLADMEPVEFLDMLEVRVADLMKDAAAALTVDEHHKTVFLRAAGTTTRTVIDAARNRHLLNMRFTAVH